MRHFILALCCGTLLPGTPLVAADEPAWTRAYKQGPLSADETRQFMKRLADYVTSNHLKQNADSPQRGLCYEYFDVQRKGEFDQFVQGEALDTMHDGAWLAKAMATAYRATGDARYKQVLVEWQLPFYVKMLNHSDTLFTNQGSVAQPNAAAWDKPWKYQEGEKGFVPYWWDDGNSVSLERRRTKNLLPIRPSHDNLAAGGNPQFRLDGYSLGMSNHLSQDLGVMLLVNWLLFKDGQSESDRKLAEELAAAAKHLQECRMRHFGYIPMCVAPAAVANQDAELLKHVPAHEGPRAWEPSNHYTRALYAFRPGQKEGLPGFADDQEFFYYYTLARHGGTLPESAAFQLIYDAYTHPLLYASYCDDVPAPPGINKFDLHPFFLVDGKHVDYRSDRKGPGGKPRPVGSRMGPQNMVVTGLALQLLRQSPEVWEHRYREQFAGDLRAYFTDLANDTRYSEPVELGGVKLRLASDRTQLRLAGTAENLPVTLTVFSRPDGQGTHAKITIKADGSMQAVNDQGTALEVSGGPQPSGGFRIDLPYTVVKSQKLWGNGIEHGRYSLAVGDQRRNVYLASDVDTVRAGLERELGRGLRTWQAIFDHYGFIPTGIDAGADWHRFSDCGGYAHLISAGSQWLNYLAQQNDWETHRIPRVK